MNTTPIVKRRACVACTNAKAKCTPQTVDMCQRCARLGKSCTYLDVPQTKRRHRTAPSRVELLEKKVDQLLSQLDTSTRQSRPTLPESFTPLPNNDQRSSRNHDLESTDIAVLLDAANDPSHGPDPPTNSVLESKPSIVDRGLMSEAEAERLVTTYRMNLIYRFPFVMIEPEETAALLRNREPFLFLCVVAATMSSAHPLRKTVAEEIMNHVTSRIVARSERNLGLLQGLLVHCAWYSYPAEKHHPRLLLLTDICVSMTYDLRLQKKHSLDPSEQRALLGAYWLSNRLAASVGRPSTMKYDTRIDDCVTSLRSTGNLSDLCISPLLHCQSFLSSMEEAYASIQAGGGRALMQVTRGSLQREYDLMKARVEKDLACCPSSIEKTLRIEFQYAEMRLDELSLREDLWNTAPLSTVRTNMLMGIIHRSKELIQTLINLPALELNFMTIITSACLCAATVIMSNAVMALLNLISTGSADSTTEAQVQAVVDMAEYPKLITELAAVLDTKFGGMSVAEKEADIVGSVCLKMRLLARCYPYQIRAIVGNNAPLPHDTQQVSSLRVAEENNGAMTQAWASIVEDHGDMFAIDDIQWDQLLSGFTGFS